MCAKTRPHRGRVFCRPHEPFAENIRVPPEVPEDPVALPITGELDLHTFRPDEFTALLEDYFTECRHRGLLRVRVIHGKGTGTLRTTVHTHLRRSLAVQGFVQGDEHSGGWGATIVTLKPGDSC